VFMVLSLRFVQRFGLARPKRRIGTGGRPLAGREV